FVEHLARLPRSSAVQPLALLSYVGGSPVRHGVRQACAISRAFEAIGMADDPARHITAVAPASDGQPALVSDADFDPVVYAAQYVLVIDLADEFRVRLGELRAIIG